MNEARKIRPQTRREFLAHVAFAGAVPLVYPALRADAGQTSAGKPAIVVFSKIFQELKLDFQQAATLAAEAGLQGVDAPVRPGGEVLPERVKDDLPRYVQELRKQGLSMPLLTTAITGVDSPKAEDILRTAKTLGARHYRLGAVYREQKANVGDQIRELRARFKDLAALNKELGLGALMQNHSPAGKSIYLAGDLSEMRQLVDGFNPEEIGVAFDIGHAIAVHGADWRGHFDALRPHFQIAYIKDINQDRHWVKFGQGEIGQSQFFSQLKQLDYSAPFSLHIEYEWDKGPQGKTRLALLSALKESSGILRGWIAKA
jgi:sugar phosphate isomerase/epimerase